jgi:hypothetical protein
MKKRYWVATVATVLGISSGVALAADLNPSQIGSSCPAGTIGNYHFVNNQTGGAAYWDSGDFCGTGPYAVQTNTQHFRCFATGALTSAATDLPGKLVLSDWTCSDVKNPPPCDPKTEICPK